MKSQGLLYFTDIEITIAAMFIFVTLFIGLVIWVNRKSADPIYKKLSQAPLLNETSRTEELNHGR